MAFIKHGDGKILSVIPENELTEEQKKALKESAEMANKSDNKFNSNNKLKN